MRKLWITLAVLVGLIIVAIAALPFVLDVNKYRPRIQAELEKRTGRAVSLGKMDLKLFPLAFRVENATIGEDPAFGTQHPFAETSQLLVSAKLMPLLHGDVQVDSISLEKPRIELVRNAQGVWNFSTIGKNAAPAPATPQQAPQAKPQPAQPSTQSPQNNNQDQSQNFSLAELKVNDGQVAITDLQKHQPRAIYDHIDLTLQDYAPGQEMKVALTAHLPGAGKQEISLEGAGGPMNAANPTATNFKGSLKLDQVSLAGVQKFLNSQALTGMDFTATGSADIASKSGNLSSKGNLTLADGMVNGVKIGYPVTADYDVAADLNSDVYVIKKGSLKLGSTPLSVTGTMNAGPTPAQLDMKVNASNASISEAARLASAFGVAFNPGMTINGKLDADVAARGAANRPALNGTVNGRELVISGKDLPQAVQVTSVNLQLSPESIRSNEFVATTGATAVKVSFALSGYASGNNNIDATVRTDKAQLGELLHIAQAYGVSAAEGVGGSGNVTLDVRAQGPLKDANNLVYSGSGALTNASVTMPALTQPAKVANADLKFNQNSATLDNLRISLGSTNATGQLTLKGLAPGATPQAQFSLNADKFDAAEWKTLFRDTPVASAAAFSLLPTVQAAVPAEAPLLQRLTGGGNVQVGNLVYDQLQMSNVRGTVTLDHGLIRLAPFTGQIYGGSSTGSVVVDTRKTPSTYTVATKVEKVDANQLMSSLSGIKKTLYGLLAANADTSFTASQSTDAAKTLNGTVNLNLENGKVAGIDLLNQLAAIGKFAGMNRATEPFTNVARLTGDFNIKNGLATTNNLKAVIDGGTLSAKGSVNLANEALDMALTAVLSKDYSQSVGGTGIGGYLTTALANKNGELVMPVIVSGTLSSPKIVPDVQTLARMKLENVVPSVGGILGSLGKGGSSGGGNLGQSILDALKGKPSGGQGNAQPQGQARPESDQIPDPSKPKSSDQTQQQQAKPQNPLGDLINSVIDKNKKKPAQPQQQPAPKQEPPK